MDHSSESSMPSIIPSPCTTDLAVAAVHISTFFGRQNTTSMYAPIFRPSYRRSYPLVLFCFRMIGSLATGEQPTL